MNKRLTVALTLGLALVGSAAFAAEACKCCKDGEKMACCDEMKGKGEAPKPGADAPHAEHQH